AYVKRGKTDAADAAAICEAVSRPTMRFVPIKTAEQQAVLMLHRTRDLLVRQRTMLVNARPSWPYGRVGHHRTSRYSTRRGPDGPAVRRGYDERAGAGPRGASRVGRGTRGTGQAREGDRGSDREVAQRQRGQPPARRYSRCRADHGIGDRRHDYRPFSVPLRSAPCGLDRAGAQTAQQRRQTAPRWDLQTG